MRVSCVFLYGRLGANEISRFGEIPGIMPLQEPAERAAAARAAHFGERGTAWTRTFIAYSNPCDRYGTSLRSSRLADGRPWKTAGRPRNVISLPPSRSRWSAADYVNPARR